MSRPMTIGRGGSMIDDFMERAVEDTVNAAHTAYVQIRGASVPTGSAGSDGRPPMHSPLYWSGTARVQALSVPSQVEGAGDAISSRRYLVQCESDVEAGAGMRVLVITSTDVTLTGRGLIVRSATRGSVRGQRDLICTLESQEPIPVDLDPVDEEPDPPGEDD